MLTKFSIIPFLVSIALAYRIEAPREPAAVGSPLTIRWVKEANDPPTFTIELQNPSFNNDLALATTVDGSIGEYTVPALQSVKEGNDYVIRFVQGDNINIQFGESPPFFVSATPRSTTASTTSSSRTSSSTGRSSSTSASVTGPATQSSTSGFGATLSNTATPTSSSTDSAAPSGSGQPLNGARGLSASFGAVLGAAALVAVLA